MTRIADTKTSVAKRIYYLGTNMHKLISAVKCASAELSQGQVPREVALELRDKKYAGPKSIMVVKYLKDETWTIIIDNCYEILVKKCGIMLALWDASITEYVALPSLEQVAYWIGTSKSNLSAISAREQWASNREKEANKVIDTAIAKRREGLADILYRDFEKRQRITSAIISDYEKQTEELKKKGKYYITNKDLFGAMQNQRSDTLLIMKMVQESKIAEYVNSMKEDNLLIETSNDDS